MYDKLSACHWLGLDKLRLVAFRLRFEEAGGEKKRVSTSSQARVNFRANPSTNALDARGQQVDGIFGLLFLNERHLREESSEPNGSATRLSVVS